MASFQCLIIPLLHNHSSFVMLICNLLFDYLLIGDCETVEKRWYERSTFQFWWWGNICFCLWDNIRKKQFSSYPQFSCTHCFYKKGFYKKGNDWCDKYYTFTHCVVLSKSKYCNADCFKYIENITLTLTIQTSTRCTLLWVHIEWE